MADFTQIIQEINDEITTNGVGAITGAKLNEVLRDMIAAVNAEKQDPLTIDATPTEDSTNPVQSGGVYNALQDKPTIYQITDIQAIPPTILSILRAGDILRGGADYESVAVVFKIENNDIYFVSTDGDTIETFLYRNGVFYDYFAYQLSDLANKVPDATQGDLVGLDSDGNLTDSGIAASDVATTSDLAGKQDTISDLATIRSGAAAGATAYQKPSGGIPSTDLASGVQTSLGKADTAVQQVTVGTTTTGNAGTNASVTNSGTVTNPVLDFTIPRGADGADGQDGADAVNPFKGWWPDLATLKAAHTATAGDSAYVKDASPATTWSIYVYDSTASSDNYWADSGRTADTSNVQTFASGEEVNEVHIVNDLTTGGIDDVLSAEQGKILEQEVSQLDKEVNGFKYEGAFVITSTGEHSSNNDRITFPSPIPAGEYTFKVESGTTGNSGNVQFSVHCIGDSSNTMLSPSVAIGTSKTYTLSNPIDSIGIYMTASTNQHTGTMPLTIQSVAASVKDTIDDIEQDLEALSSDVDNKAAYLRSYRFIGDGYNFSGTDIYGLKKGKTYTIELQDPSLCSDTISDTSVAKFQVSYQSSESAFTNLVNIRVGSGDVAATYNFTIPNNFVENGKVKVGGRAVAGKVVNFFIKEAESISYVTYGMARCNTAANVSDKVVTIPNLTSVNTEAVRFIVFMEHSTSTSATLKVNGAEAKNLYYNGIRASGSNSWADGEKLDITYNANYPAYFAVTIPNFKKSINAQSPDNNKFVSEAAIVEYIENGASKSVLSYNTDKISAITSAVSRSPLSYEKINNNLCFAFSILTDLHSDIDRFDRACVFADSISEIEGTFCLGDMINTSNSANPYPNILNYTKPIIPITGNHEVLKKSADSITGWDEAALLANMYSSDLVTHNGETHPEGKCYWHKDYTKTIDGVTKKLRVIGLHQYEGTGTGDQNTGSGKDVTFYTQAQIDWLIARLDECDANTMVMILMHFAPTNAMTKIDCSFTPSDSFNFPTSGGSTTGGQTGSMSDNLFLPKIVQAWIDGTTLNISCDITVGETVTTINAIKSTAFAAHDKQFVGWFTGHTHRDLVCKITDYPKQMVISFICTSANSAQNSCDIGRSTTGKSQDCFTIVSVDWLMRSVNLIRIGADVTTDMCERKYCNIKLS